MMMLGGMRGHQDDSLPAPPQGLLHGLLPNATLDTSLPATTSKPRQQILFADPAACRTLAVIIKNLNKTKVGGWLAGWGGGNAWLCVCV